MRNYIVLLNLVAKLSHYIIKFKLYASNLRTQFVF